VCRADGPGGAESEHRHAQQSIEATIEDAAGPDTRLVRALGPLPLTLMGIGVPIGAGIFVLTGTAAANYAGPGVVGTARWPPVNWPPGRNRRGDLIRAVTDPGPLRPCW
jgi:hypothetical protein